MHGPKEVLPRGHFRGLYRQQGVRVLLRLGKGPEGVVQFSLEVAEQLTDGKVKFTRGGTGGITVANQMEDPFGVAQDLVGG